MCKEHKKKHNIQNTIYKNLFIETLLRFGKNPVTFFCNVTKLYFI